MQYREILRKLVEFMQLRLGKPELDEEWTLSRTQYWLLVPTINALEWVRGAGMSLPLDNVPEFNTLGDLAQSLFASQTRVGKSGASGTKKIEWKGLPEVSLDMESIGPSMKRLRRGRAKTADVEFDQTSTTRDMLCSLWYGTNRKPVDATSVESGFSGERDTETHLGVCRVFIPKGHKIGSTGSSWWDRLKFGDDRIVLKNIDQRSGDRFWSDMLTHLSSLEIGEREALIFIHGYNVSFEQAAIRAAQIGTDLSVRGCMAFFSWPSKGQTENYIADEASIEASEAAITSFLADFSERSGASKIHIIAHSMGNRGVLRAINRIAARATKRTGRPFNQIILAAPDVDADVFRDLCGAYPKVCDRTTLYISSKDVAVGASEWLHAFPRAGLLPPILLVPDIDTVNVTHSDLTLLGHGYVADSRIVLTDMHTILKFGAPPRDRMGIQAQTSGDGRPYWLIGR